MIYFKPKDARIEATSVNVPPMPIIINAMAKRVFGTGSVTRFVELNQAIIVLLILPPTIKAVVAEIMKLTHNIKLIIALNQPRFIDTNSLTILI